MAKAKNQKENVTKKEVSKMIQTKLNKEIEMKYKRTPHPYSALGTTALVQNLCLIANTVGDNGDRIGDEIRLVSLRSNIRMEVGDAFNTIRLIYFQWNADNSVDLMAGAGVNLNKILSSFTNGTGVSTDAASNMISQYFFDNLRANKFTILYDKVHTLTSDMPVKNFNVELKLYKDRKTKKSCYFKGGLSTQSTNAIYLAAFSDSTTATHPYFGHYTQINYRDA